MYGCYCLIICNPNKLKNKFILYHIGMFFIILYYFTVKMTTTKKNRYWVSGIHCIHCEDFFYLIGNIVTKPDGKPTDYKGFEMH